MLRPDRDVERVFLHRAPVDMRKQMDGLSILAKEIIQQDPMSGSMFVFINARRNKLKILVWERNGFFTPDAQCTWLLTEIDPDDGLTFGLCDLGHERARTRLWIRSLCTEPTTAPSNGGSRTFLLDTLETVCKGLGVQCGKS